MQSVAHPRMERAWEMARERFAGYELILPGVPTFICQAELCSAHCCKAFSVSLTENEVSRLERLSHKNRQRFLECEDGEPIALPLADPFLLARRNGHCGLLGDDLLCSEYEGRPDACRLYPHHVVFVNESSGRPAWGDRNRYRAALQGRDTELVPLLLRHLECPGFTGPPILDDDWEDLFFETYRLQYHDREPFPDETRVRHVS